MIKKPQEKIIICFVCKIKMNKTELKDVYKCIACGLIDDRKNMEERS